MATPKHTSHKRHDSALVDSYNGLPPLLPKAAPPKCHLLELPADIRNIIYNLLFYEPEGILIDFSNDNYQAGLGSITYLASTCRHIYNECRDLPQWLNTLHFRVPVFQDLQAVRAISPSMLKFPLPSRTPSPKSRRTKPPPAPAVIEWSNPHSLQFVTTVMRDRHIEAIVERLDEVFGQYRITSKLRKVHIDLGSITNNTFLERFHHAWEEVAPRLAALSGSMSLGAELRLIFQLRLSRRFVVNYDFSLKERMAAMREMDLCVSKGAFEIEEFTLPELRTINAIRTRVWKTFFLSGEPDDVGLPPRLSRTFPTFEEFKEARTLQRAFGSPRPLVQR